MTDTAPAPPPAMLRRTECVLAELRIETHDTKTFRFALPAESPVAALPNFRAGQFYALEVQGESGWIRRSYSISSPPSERRGFDVTIKRVDGGAATGVLFDRMKVGDRVRATGPFGEFVLDESRPAVFIAGGVGITPIFSMLRDLDERGFLHASALLYSNRARADVIFERELQEMAARRPALRIEMALTRAASDDRIGWHGRVSRFDPSDVERVCAEHEGAVAYLCGPVPFMEELGRACLRGGIPADRIRTEAFLGVSPQFGAA